MMELIIDVLLTVGVVLVIIAAISDDTGEESFAEFLKQDLEKLK